MIGFFLRHPRERGPLKSGRVSPDSIYDFDETKLIVDPDKRKVLCKSDAEVEEQTFDKCKAALLLMF